MITLHGEDELLARAGHLFAAREEFICAATNLSTWTRRGMVKGHLRQVSIDEVGQRVANGLLMRKMYNPAAVADPEDAAHLREVQKSGVHIRICPTALPHETIIIDKRIAIMAGASTAGVRDFSVIMSPEAVAGVRSLFLATWAGATDLADFLPATPQIDDQEAEILRLLSAGQKDEAAARAMGVSVRTYRRRVAELMVLLGAESRFQAGERARALGLRW